MIIDFEDFNESPRRAITPAAVAWTQTMEAIQNGETVTLQSLLNRAVSKFERLQILDEECRGAVNVETENLVRLFRAVLREPFLVKIAEATFERINDHEKNENLLKFVKTEVEGLIEHLQKSVS